MKMKLGAALVVLLGSLSLVPMANAQIQTPEAAGRWQVVVTSGDTPQQVATGNPTEFDVLSTGSSTSARGYELTTYDTAVCDEVGFDNINSTITQSGNTYSFSFVVNTPAGSFTYNFKGSPVKQNGTTLTGTYNSTAGGCNNGKGLGVTQGNFIAYWYPDLAGPYEGTLEPDDNSGPEISTTITFSQGTDGFLTGTVSTNSACFANGKLTVEAGTAPSINTSDVSGGTFEVYAVDKNGVVLQIVAAAVTDGNNSAYNAYYAITGGSCDGQGGGDAPFVQVVRKRRGAPINNRIITPRLREFIRISR